MPPDRILIIGGTAEAREIAEALASRGGTVMTSLAGVTRQPIRPEGELRVGGFGGAEGLASFLKEQAIALVIDASHPFATRISANAVEASGKCGVPIFRFERPAWQPEPGDNWIFVNDVVAAASALTQNARVMLTIGRKEVAPFFQRHDLSGLVRSIEPPAGVPTDRWTLVLARPPFAVASELALMDEHQITHLVAKNAGGNETAAKLTAARQRRIPVTMISRPVKTAAKIFSCLSDIVLAAERQT
jgi:precorrin-6A/cobalt-precorrin-6A reductase